MMILYHFTMIDHFDIIASVYDRLIGPPKVDRLKELLRLPINGWMLDAGGGTGRVSSQFRELVDHLIICDLSHPMLIEANKKKGLLTVQAHIERLPFPDETFDRILVVDALHHFHKQQETIQDLWRVLKTGGILVIEEPDIHRWAVKFVALLEKLLLMRSHFMTLHDIHSMLLVHGSQTEIITDGGFAGWIIAKK